MRKDFELLAPAGSFEILKAVIEAGADAVYVGGSRFGARAYANNFTEEELLEAIDYVHLREKKLFLTVNTLFKNNELEEGLYEYLLPYYERGLDAVIVQDFGVIAYLREHFPLLPIHTSTQMTVTGAEGAKLLKDLGAERVVLARELSIAEMKQIRKEADVELEAFVHGALCYSYSGQCLFSSILGGRSGNRGRCAQPCRLPYTVLDENKKLIKKESHILSLKDLCGINYLQQLREAGVYSLKIEGRMKQASYAAGVVSYYRKYIDLEKETSKEDMQHIFELGNRCGFTTEYFSKRNDRSMITFEKPSYEKSNESLHQEMERKYVGQKSKLPITGVLKLKKGELASLKLEYLNTEAPEERFLVELTGQEVSEARNKPLAYEAVKERMHKTGESSFTFTSLEIFMDPDIFVPNGMLNQLRRDALNLLEHKLLLKYNRHAENKAENKCNDEEKTVENQGFASKAEIICACETEEQLQTCLMNSMVDTIYIDSQMFPRSVFLDRLKAVLSDCQSAKKEVYLRLPAIFRQPTAEYFASIAEELKTLDLKGYVVRNYEELQFIKSNFNNVILVADHSLYTYNDKAKAAFEAQNIHVTCVPLELNQKEIRKRNNRNSEMVIYGHYPLMTSAGCVHKNSGNCNKQESLHYLKDRYQVCFPVKNFCNDCYNIIYNSVPTLLFKEREMLMEQGLLRQRLEFTVEDGQAVRNVLELLCGRGKEIEYTKGHYKRGVE